jgi:hypothetical protein
VAGALSQFAVIGEENLQIRYAALIERAERLRLQPRSEATHALAVDIARFNQHVGTFEKQTARCEELNPARPTTKTAVVDDLPSTHRSIA